MRDKIRYVFFDVDGVLSAPAYYDDKEQSLAIGFSDEGWDHYLLQEGVYAYRHCRPVPAIKSYIRKLKDSKIPLYVLSSVCNETERQAKILFIQNNYPETFTDLYFVRHDADKIVLLKDFAEKKQIYLSSCLLVDDTYDLLLKAHCAGISCAHVSNVLADNISF